MNLAGHHVRRSSRNYFEPCNASNDLANNLSSCIPQGCMTARSSSANPRESTAAGNSANDPASGNVIIQSSSANPLRPTLTEAEKGPRKSRTGSEIQALERLNL